MPLPDVIQTPAYRKAFELYLRKGVPIELSLKAAVAQEHSTTHYVWRTRGDNKVRATHAVNNGRIFSWDNPPPTGHPGENYGCRCTAEPYVHGESEFAYQVLISVVNDSSPEWEWMDFVWHAIKGGGDVTLSQIGHLRGIINHYAYHLAENWKFEDVNRQVIDKARGVGNGYFTYRFSRSYNFRPISFPYGDSTVSGMFTGHVTEKNGVMKIDGSIDYFFDDDYTDPVDIRQLFLGESDPAAVAEFVEFVLEAIRYNLIGSVDTEEAAKILLHTNTTIRKDPADASLPMSVSQILGRIKQSILKALPDNARVDAIAELFRYITDGGGGVYAITDQWQTDFHAQARLNESDSLYQWPKK